ncbi:SDR family NAD(P)-dependent oxidoreductase [Tateyamaria pelophila]|uniref:SDR family NAD(P)-dependent oxidoreductase n=1 Tax=Tateyamaria pelophila TaxID=328415 RepID=UPI001CBF5F38|nr:SDR family oxidoreductase [Tateyamaria pelophila]
MGLTQNNPLEVAGRCYLVSGAAGGLAKPIVAELLERGARLILMDTDTDGLNSVIAAHGDENAIAFTGDITDQAALDAAVDLGQTRFGCLHGGLNAAGLLPIAASDSMDADLFRQCIDVNLTGAFLFSQALAPALRAAGGGRIVHIASVSSMVSNPAYAAYAGSKGGLAQIVRVLGREWAADSIAVNAIGPALTETALTRDYLSDPAFRARAIGDIPMGRLGLPEDLVGLALLLFGPGGGFITGQTIYVDGGRTLV